MARASFGGGGDFSGFFGSLYNAGKSKARADQNAKDSDMADKWQNGLITDQEWIDYIRSRIDAETDPKYNQKWVEALRKYGPAIADAQMVDKYENGEITIGELITHYTGRLTGLEPDSNEYRQVTKTLNDLKDKRDGDNLSKKAEDLINKIEAGQASYDELLKLYKDQLKTLRPNSSLYEQVQGQIEKVNDTIKSNKIEGELSRQQYLLDTGKTSAGSFAAAVRKLALNFKTSDPARYWSLMKAASGAVSGGRSGGGGGGSSSGGSSSTSTIDAIQGERNRLQAIVDQIESGAKQGVDPKTGNVVAFTPAYIKSIDQQLLSTFDSLESAYRNKTDSKGRSKPDLSAAANTSKAKTAYIIDHVQKHNTVAKDEQGRNILNATVKRLNAAAELDDPDAARQAVINAAKDFDRWTQGLNKTVINNGEDDVRIGSQLGLQDQVTPEYLSVNQALASALNTIANSNDEQAIQGAIDSLGQAGVDSSVIKAITEPSVKVVARAEAVANGDMVQVMGIDGKIKWVETSPVSRSVPDPTTGSLVNVVTKEPDPAQLAQEAGFTGDEQTKLVDVYIDRNGEPTKVKAVVQLTGTGAAWTTTKQITVGGLKIPAGVRLDAKQVALIKKQYGLGASDSLAGYDGIMIGNAINYYQANVNGETWVQDPSTNLWYKGTLPIRGLVTTADGTMEIDPSTGQATFDRKAYASAGGVAAIYEGTNNRAMQSVIDNLDPQVVASLRGVDANGNLVPFDQNDLGDMYYSPINPYTGFNLDGESWWKQSDRDAKAQAKYDKYTAQIRGTETGDISFKTLGKTKDVNPTGLDVIAKALGITFGTKTDARHRGLVDKRDQVTKPASKIGGQGTGDIFHLPDPQMSTGPKVSASTGFVLPDTKPTTKANVTGKTNKPKPLPKVTAPKPPKVLKDTASANDIKQAMLDAQKSGSPAGRL